MAGLPYSRKDGVVGRRCSGARKNFFSISPFYLVSCVILQRRRSHLSTTPLAGWFLMSVSCSPCSGGCFPCLFIMVRGGRNRLLISYCGVIWGGISGISGHQLFDSTIMNWAFPDGNMGDSYDLAFLLKEKRVNKRNLKKAITSTFRNRGTSL